MIIINIHIPKNGGTTFNDIIRRNFSEGYVPFYDYHQKHRHSVGEPLAETDFLAFLESCPNSVKFISGHHLRPLSQVSNQEYGLAYITFIRHPIERILSLYHYERKWSSRRPEVYGHDHCSQKPFEEYFQIRKQEDTALTNWQVYDLTGGFSAETAINLLENFLFVGLVEEFDKSIVLLQKIFLDKKLLQAFDTGYLRLNTAGSDKLTRADLSVSLREKILEMNQEDLKLFNYAQQLLHQQLGQIENLSLIELNHSVSCLSYKWRRHFFNFIKKLERLPAKINA